MLREHRRFRSRFEDLDCPYMFKEELSVENCNEDRARHVSQSIRSSTALRSVTLRGWGHAAGSHVRLRLASDESAYRHNSQIDSVTNNIWFDSFRQTLIVSRFLVTWKEHAGNSYRTRSQLLFYFWSESVHSDIRIVTDNLSMSRIFDEQTRIYKDEKRNASYQEREWDHS